MKHPSNSHIFIEGSLMHMSQVIDIMHQLDNEKDTDVTVFFKDSVKENIKAVQHINNNFSFDIMFLNNQIYSYKFEKADFVICSFKLYKKLSLMSSVWVHTINDIDWLRYLGYATNNQYELKKEWG